jgi:hypothetical protein
MEQLAPTAREFPQALSWLKSEAGLATTLLIVSGPGPLFVSLTFWLSPEVPTYWPGKVTLDGVMVSIKDAPVPVRATVCVPPGAVSVTTSDALSGPKAVGVKVTLMVQLLFAPRDEGQLLVCEKSVLFALLIWIEVMLNGRLPMFVRVTTCGLLVIPTVSLPKAKLAGASFANGSRLI